MKNSVRLFIFMSALCLAFLPTAAARAGGLLPDAIDEWNAVSESTTELRTASEDLGRWDNRIYRRNAPVALIEVNLTEGSGAGTLRVPDGDFVRDDAPLGFVSVYKTLEVAGHRAILERGEVTGQALAVASGENRALTVESKSISEEELLSFTERLIYVLHQADKD